MLSIAVLGGATMKRLCERIISILLLTALIVISVCGCNKRTDQEQFNELINDIFIQQATSDSLSLHYLLAHPENYGIKHKKTTLGTYSVKQMQTDLVDTENSLAKLNKINPDTLDGDSQTTYYILKQSLNSSLSCGKYTFLHDQLGPTTGLQAQLPILLAEYAFSTKDDIHTYIELLNCVSNYFTQICDYEIEKSKSGYFMCDEVADSIISQCKDFIANPETNFLISYFNEKLSTFEGLTLKEKLLLEEANRDAVLHSVIPAYQTLIDTLTALKGTGKNSNGLCYFEGGKEYYELMVQSSTGSSKTVNEMKTALKSTLNQCFAVLTTLSIQDSTLYQQYQNLVFPYEDPNDIMEYLATAMEEDFPSIDSVSYSVKYVHESLQNHLSPAMYIVPPIDDASNNNIYINNLPAYDMTKIFPTVAHEGYPGHLYQNVYFSQQNKHPIRSVINITGYDEGWATYVECYSYGLAKLNENLAKFLQANMIAIHCLYSLTDIGIHYDGWTKEKTVNFWRNYVITEEDAENIYYSILAEPGIYLPYSIGYIEIMELKALAKEVQGSDFTLKNFHQYYLDFGPAPFELLRKGLSN